MEDLFVEVQLEQKKPGSELCESGQRRLSAEHVCYVQLRGSWSAVSR